LESKQIFLQGKPKIANITGGKYILTLKKITKYTFYADQVKTKKIYFSLIFKILILDFFYFLKINLNLFLIF